MKKVFVGVFAAMLLTAACCVTGFAAQEKAVPSAAKVSINEKQIDFQAYNINGNTYFKLRDISAAMYGTEAGFKTEYDAAQKAMILTKGAVYVSDYTIDSTPLKDTKKANISTQSVLLDGKKIDVTAYNIDGYNYFKLRDLGKALGFEVAWDSTAKAIAVQAEESLPGYMVEWDSGEKLTYVWAIFNVEGYDTEFSALMAEEEDGSVLVDITKYAAQPDGSAVFEHMEDTVVENYFEEKILSAMEANGTL